MFCWNCFCNCFGCWSWSGVNYPNPQPQPTQLPITTQHIQKTTATAICSCINLHTIKKLKLSISISISIRPTPHPHTYLPIPLHLTYISHTPPPPPLLTRSWPTSRGLERSQRYTRWRWRPVPVADRALPTNQSAWGGGSIWHSRHASVPAQLRQTYGGLRRHSPKDRKRRTRDAACAAPGALRDWLHAPRLH